MIVYFISNYDGINTGRGGHYYSLLQVAKGIRKHKKVLIISIGNNQPSLYLELDYAYHINSTLGGLRKTIKKINRLLDEITDEPIEVIHGYDQYTVYYANVISKQRKSKTIITKCGGSTKKNFPSVQNLIVFHKKDFDYYKVAFRNSRVFLIPNRVTPVKKNNLRNDQLEQIYTPNYYHIVKIGRIGKQYQYTLKQSINLAAFISSHKKVRLSFIGYLENNKYLEELQKYAISKKVDLKFYTEDSFTKNASELIFGADIVVGTGRGAMEALSSEKVLFVPVKNHELPCLFDQNTSEFIMENNFSERTVIPERLDSYFNENIILENINKQNKIFNLKKYGLRIFDKWYSIDTGSEKILSVYQSIKINHTFNKLTLFIRYKFLFIKLILKKQLKLLRYYQ